MTVADKPLSLGAPVLVRTRNIRGAPAIVGCAAVLIILVALGYVLPAMTSLSVTSQDLASRLMAPSAAHWFGTDELGRDVFIRTIYASRIDIPLAVVAAIIPAMAGTLIGLVAGYSGRVTDSIIMRIADVVQAFPGYVLLILVAFVMGAGPFSFITAVTALNWVSYTRLVRSQVLLLREMDFIHAARLAGFGRLRLMLRHLLPNTLPQVVVYMASDATLDIVFLASLSFLGLGIPEPTPEWGLMIQDGQLYLQNAWWLAVFPGLFLVIAAGAFAFMSDAVNDRIQR